MTNNFISLSGVLSLISFAFTLSKKTKNPLRVVQVFKERRN
jgi:hypothetical protein